MARGTDADLGLLATVEAIETAGAVLQDLVGARGLLDPTLAGIVSTFAAHHREHAAAYQRARSAPQPAAADSSTVERLSPAILNAVDGPTLASASLAVERALAATAVDLVGKLTDPASAAVAAGIAPVEAQHATVLSVASFLPASDATPELVLTDGSLLGG